ncbi:polysaccharide biosynthesis protein [Anaerosalibacter bizertensis]|uniref:polysaccharide biosynthesis protein n=1 Tax=Anaerosalibacter bizertensis TaxID=932217 RepID=UPI001C0E9476|nr:nucleoside-diphosphate sugar epimerase/dehydratase [Anaerosalibacter bizertensis]MBU5294787.1 polysaccharide biosynthesis protein [Anaerosalibacter bizertensis]
MKRRKYMLALLDVILISLAYYLSLYLRFDGKIAPMYLKVFKSHIVIITSIKIFIFYLFKLYKSLWRFASIDEMIDIVLASIVANAVVIAYMTMVEANLPRSIYFMVPIMDIAFIGGSRFSYRALKRIESDIPKGKEGCKNVLIVGAGAAGAMVIKEFRNHNRLNSRPVAIVDDDFTKIGQNINGVPVLGTRDDIPDICKTKDVDEIIIAIPSANKKDISEIISECKKTKCRTKTLPGIYELIDGKVSINKIRDVDIGDLLGREEIHLDMDDISGYIRGKKVLVTGGGGSIGSELCRQIARFEPEELAILDIYENNVYDIQNELKRKYKRLNLKVIIASVRDKDRIESIIDEERPDVVFHAAAHKHVPLMEENPEEAIKNNVFGTLNLVQATDKYNVKKFVLISTDKAVNPTNVMGTTKRICEMIIQSINKESSTEFVAVRFGNVLGSNGSVIPLFKKQIAEGGPVTVTHPEVIRYFMTIPEACQLVLQAGAMADGGEIFILDMGEPVKIMDLAKDLIRLSGFEPDVDIPIEITGLRPGEKLYEELLLDEEGISDTGHNKIFIGKPIFTDYKYLIKSLEKLKYVMEYSDNIKLKKALVELVPTYEPYKEDSLEKQYVDHSKRLNEVAISAELSNLK